MCSQSCATRPLPTSGTFASTRKGRLPVHTTCSVGVAEHLLSVNTFLPEFDLCQTRAYTPRVTSPDWTQGHWVSNEAPGGQWFSLLWGSGRVLCDSAGRGLWRLAPLSPGSPLWWPFPLDGFGLHPLAVKSHSCKFHYVLSPGGPRSGLATLGAVLGSPSTHATQNIRSGNDQARGFLSQESGWGKGILQTRAVQGLADG